MITEEEIKAIQAKKYIDVKEFTIIYGYSAKWQQRRRSRLHDSLPYIQEKFRGKIIYKIEEIEYWFFNNNIVKS